MIQAGNADMLIVGGAEAGSAPAGLAGFCQARALSTRNDDPERASRPWDKDRDGFVLGDGSGVLLLEDLEHAKKRDAKIYAERSEEHTSELQSLMRISYAVFCLKKKKKSYILMYQL